jgi:hypothetical protein
MCSRDLCAYSGFAFGHYRIGKADDIDAFLQEGISKTGCQCRITQHHGDDNPDYWI